MSRPRIAINCNLDAADGGRRSRRKVTISLPYIDAVVAAGGLPILVPPSSPDILADYLTLADGVLFTGGADYPPETYGEKARPEVEPQTAERSRSDLDLMQLALNAALPTLGICAGLQLLNVRQGGALIQHLDGASDHTAPSPEDDNHHPVGLVTGTRLHQIMGAVELEVNSAHHQAADPLRLGRGLKVSAIAPDGTIEALELDQPGDQFLVAVQWHPERIRDEAHRRRLFAAFIDACRANSRGDAVGSRR